MYYKVDYVESSGYNSSVSITFYRKQPMSKTNNSELSSYIDKIELYIELEYDIKLVDKMNDKKYSTISYGYIKNCFSLNKTVPVTARGLVKYLQNTL